MFHYITHIEGQLTMTDVFVRPLFCLKSQLLTLGYLGLFWVEISDDISRLSWDDCPWGQWVDAAETLCWCLLTKATAEWFAEELVPVSVLLVRNVAIKHPMRPFGSLFFLCLLDILAIKNPMWPLIPSFFSLFRVNNGYTNKVVVGSYRLFA